MRTLYRLLLAGFLGAGAKGRLQCWCPRSVAPLNIAERQAVLLSEYILSPELVWGQFRSLGGRLTDHTSNHQCSASSYSADLVVRLLENPSVL